MNALRRGLGNSLVQAFLVVVGLVWVTPLAGLFLSSLRSAQDTAKGGWWTALAGPSQLSFDNYSALLGNAGMTRAFWNTVLISVPATLVRNKRCDDGSYEVGALFRLALGEQSTAPAEALA